MTHRFPALIAAPAPAQERLWLTEPRLLSDPGRIWLVLQLGVPVAGQALSGPALSGPALSGPALSGPALSGPVT